MAETKPVIGKMQRFIIERVAGMGPELRDGDLKLSDNYLQRKVVAMLLKRPAYWP